MTEQRVLSWLVGTDHLPQNNIINPSYSAARPPYASSDVVVLCESDRPSVYWDVCTIIGDNRPTLLLDDPYGEPRTLVIWPFSLSVCTGGVFESPDNGLS